MEWNDWPTNDTAAARAAGISFDRTPAGPVVAPPGWIRVCAYHVDFDERPTCYVDVATQAEAAAVCAALHVHCRRNVDFAVAWDDAGNVVADGSPY